ncbi:alpha/beta fold hydrolase [Paraglaciecola sp. L1A13]|uniref:alpha/beta fold hydrolase n=1 Tax=Paraglaciecola sp. L1A13 TaxID=2686359 RepID=UPI00131AB3D2|nr:alpha/beta hydrolase [Paraglaciecola sp. L1A13]
MTKTSLAPTLFIPLEQPVIFYPGTLCDERVFMPCWQAMNIPKRAFVPLQWAETLEQMLALSGDRLDYFDEPAHLVGFSMGGYVAALTALQQPSKVASLTLIGSYPGQFDEQERQARKSIIETIQSKKYQGMSDARMQKFVFSLDNVQVLHAIKAMESDLGPSVLATQMSALSDREDLTARLATAPFKVHLLVGEQDQIAPPDKISSLSNQIVNSQLHIFDNAAHMLPLEQPVALANYFVENFS